MPASELTMIEQAANTIAPLTKTTTKVIAAAARAAPAGLVVVAASSDDRDRLHTAHRDQPITEVMGPTAGAMFVVLLTSWVGHADEYDGRPVLFDGSAIVAFAEDARRARDQYATQAGILRCANEEIASLRTALDRAGVDVGEARAARHAADIVIRDVTAALGAAGVGIGEPKDLAERVRDVRAGMTARDIIIKDATAALDRCGVNPRPRGEAGLELSNRILDLASHLPPPARVVHESFSDIAALPQMGALMAASVKEKMETPPHPLSFSQLAKPMGEAFALHGLAAARRAFDPDHKLSNPEVDELIARSSIGAGLRNIEENGIEAETADLEAEAEREVAIESMAAIRELCGAFITGPAKGSSYERLDRLMRKVLGIVAFGVPVSEAP